MQKRLMMWDIERCQFLGRIYIGHGLIDVARFDGDLITTNCGQIQLFTTEDDKKSKGIPLQNSAAERSYQWRGWGLSEDRDWLTWNGVDVLWIPLYYRPCGVVIDGSELTLVCESGMVYSLELGDPGIS